MKIDLYTQSGEKKGQLELNAEIFENKISEELIHQSLILQLANKRNPIAYTKTKGLVRGGGRKPWKQKGTGRARQGSIRAPQFKGGGIVFGPSNQRNFTKNMPKKQRRKALFSLLSAKAKQSVIIGLESYQDEKPKTKTFQQLIKKLPIERSVLIVLDQKNPALELSSRNLPNAKTILVNYLNPADLLKFKTLLFLKNALPKLEELFLTKKAK